MLQLADRKVLVLGLGDTGLSLVRFLLRHGTSVSVADSREAPPYATRLQAEFPGVTLHAGPFREEIFGDLDMIAARAEQAHASPVVARRAIRDGMRNFYGLFLAVRDLPFPTIAAINGHAIGAGLCVALACDIRVVAREARLGLNFTRLGLHPGMGATWTLPRLVGPALAAELLYTSRSIDGEEAARIGLANRALPATQVLESARTTAREAANCAPRANS